jgi:hypothetical protein
MSKQKRYKICGDDSGHEYFIPVDEVDDFYRWVEMMEGGISSDNYRGLDYDINRIDGRFTFTDPRNE